MPLRFTIAELQNFLVDVFPQVIDDFVIEVLDDDMTRVRMKISDKHLRPGGTVSGPSMFTLADCAMYMAVLARIGPQALAVTTNCSIDFMRKPVANTDIIAECRIHKLGRVLAVGDALIYSDGLAAPVARASLTYSIPPVAG
jgi:uncharacterized protein (TIGR00369 family)